MEVGSSAYYHRFSHHMGSDRDGIGDGHGEWSGAGGKGRHSAGSGVARIWLGAMEWEIKQAYTLNGVNFNFYFWLNSGISGFEVSNRCEACND